MDKTISATETNHAISPAIVGEPMDTSVAQNVTLRAASIPIDLAVQFFSSFGSQRLAADDFASVVFELAAGLKDEGRFGEAESLYLHIIDKQRVTNDPGMLVSMNNMAILLQSQGKLAEAEALLRQTLATLRAQCGHEDTVTLRTMNSLACLLQNQGKYMDARRLYLQTIEIQRRTLGTEHLDTIATLENLATLLYEQDELDSAAPLLQETVNLRRRILGDNHADSLRSFNNLALLLQKQGKYVPAESLLRQTMKGQAALLGNEHADTLTTISNLAILLEDVGQTSEAEMLHQQAYYARRKLLGDSHVDTLTSANNLAAFWMGVKRFDAAAPLLACTLETARATFPAAHFFAANVQARYGACLTALQAYGDAEAHLLEGYGKLKTALGQVHHRTQRACSAIIELYEAWGKPEKAAPFRAAAACCS